MGKIIWQYDEIPPAQAAKASALILVLHGFGDSKETFKNIGSAFARQFPAARVIVPNGSFKAMDSLPFLARMIIKAKTPPDNFNEAQKGRSWFRVNPLTLKFNIRSNNVPEVPQLNNFITAQLNRDELPDSRLILFGFSQGGAMALMTGLRRPHAPGMIISHSGFLPSNFKAASAPPVTLIRGEKEFANDERLVIRLLGMHHQNAVDNLERMMIAPQTHMIRDLGHRINEQSFSAAAHHIRKSLSLNMA